ncbi:zinc finger MYM-type protein 1-like [Aphis craccivora]|uniref:Zinc finger MYM-type protein 1-like n=1 Tax=Aphis craccivora TaxID=307492 RepID=A0A6G0VVE8_APHCR|nr:zinc finger MYM-type protein 1-like [Aphis craccivora]
MAFRGHNEQKDSCQQGNFKELINLLSKYDNKLKNHLEEGSKNAQYTSQSIQNDIIFSLHNVVFKHIKSSIANCKISIIADETSDVGHHEQLSIVIRYFDEKKK